MRLVFYILLFYSFIPTTLTAQTDSLKLFTKSGCSNCSFTKAELAKRSIAFIEYGLESKNNGVVMLKHLSNIGYKGKIYLPVIVLNNKVYHPVYETKDSLVTLPLVSVIDSLEKIVSTEQLNLALPTKNDVKSTQKLNNIESDCETDLKPIYLICQNFKVKSDASQLTAKLKSEGFHNAGFIEHQNFFRVYYTFFLDSEVANKELQNVRTQNRASYLLTIE